MSLLLLFQGGGGAPAAQSLTAARFDNNSDFYVPVVTRGAVNLTASPVELTNTFYAATVTTTRTLAAGRFDNAQAFYAPSVAPGVVALIVPRVENAQTFYAMTATQFGGPQALIAGRFDNAQAFYGPTVTTVVTLTAPRVDNDQAFFSQALSSSIALDVDLVENQQAFYTASVGAGAALEAPLVPSDEEFFSATVSLGVESISAPLVSNASQFYPPEVGKRYHEIEIVDFEPKLWWLRKPKALPEEEAKQKIGKVARTIERVVREKVEAQQEPSKREVKQAVASLVQEMPGFDWLALYQQILIQINLNRLDDEQRARQAMGRQARIEFEQDEEDALILLMAA